MTEIWKTLRNVFVRGKEEEFVYTEEPHTTRRQLILKRHPEMKKLMGHDPTITYITIPLVAVQVLICHLIFLYDPPISLLTVAFTWAVGGTITHSLTIVVHECCHNLVFGHKHAWANRILSIFANFPCAFPMAGSMKKFHADHHRWLGHDSMDVDVPTKFDNLCFRTTLTKFLWLVFNLLVQGFRPFLKSPKPLTNWEIVNFVAQFLFDFGVYLVFGWKALLYLCASIFLGLGLHPLTGRIITEHYLCSGKRFGTHSYYGSGNFFMFDVGHHVEHHDFPYIPYRRLHKVRKIAPEFYDHLDYHTSWFKAIWRFIIDPKYGPVTSDTTIDEDHDFNTPYLSPKGKEVMTNGSTLSKELEFQRKVL